MTQTPRETVAPPTGRITQIKPQEKRERLNVYIEGRFAFAVDALVALEAGLAVGQELDEERYARLESREELSKARTRALRFLETRERSSREVRDRLRRYGYDAGVIDVVLAWVIEQGFVDDGRFATAYAAEKGRAGWGPRRIASELAAKGVERELATTAAAAAGFAEGGSAEEELTALVGRKFGREAATDPRRARERARGFLLRRGHEWATADRLIERAFRSVEEDDGP